MPAPRCFAALLLTAFLAIAARESCAAPPPSPAADAEKTPAAPEPPQWIGMDGPRDVPRAFVVRRAFVAPRAVHRADLRLATDSTACEVRFNGQAVWSLDEFAPWIDGDVARHVRAGENVVELRCRGSGGPAAFAALLVVHGPDGARTVVRTDREWSAGPLGTDATSPRAAAAEFGPVDRATWDADRTARITAFDDYEQWRAALDPAGSVDPARFQVRPGFRIERVRTAAADEGSWTSMAFDPRGRLVVAREDKGLLRFTLAPDGGSVTRVEVVNETLREVRGLLFAHGDLYAMANESKGLYLLHDPDGEGPFEQVRLLREFPGKSGHGRNDLALAPDGSILAICGDSVELPTTDVLDRTSPFREARRGVRTTEGFLLRTDRDGKRWEVVAAGLRNPFGVDVHRDGEIFTYDADAEFDMGAPWYRPTRIDLLASGADFGWRGRTGAWPPFIPDRSDRALPSADIGKGSPTAVRSGARSSFPPSYREAFFALDWAYGRILACRPVPRGAGWLVRAETFLKGRPLNVTDLDFGPDGSLYVVTGGRKTRSDLYRIRWTGDAVEPRVATVQETASEAHARTLRATRRALESFHVRRDPSAVDVAWPHLGSPDPALRDAARTALEHQPVESWARRALDERDPARAVSALLSLARSVHAEFVAQIPAALDRIPFESLSTYDRLAWLDVCSLCLPESSAAPSSSKTPPATQPTGEAWDRIRARIARAWPETGARGIGPAGAGGDVNRRLAELAVRLEVGGIPERIVDRLARAETQEDRLHALFVSRGVKHGWSAAARRAWFENLADLDRTALGGQGMPGFLKQIRDDALAALSPDEKTALGDLLKPGTVDVATAPSVTRPFVKKWTMQDADALLAGPVGKRDPVRGRALFAAALCARCHRLGATGGTTGPDLSAAGGRFGRRDLLVSILAPSLVIDEKYRSVQVVTTDGKVHTGHVVSGGDYRSSVLRLATDPLNPSQIVSLDKQTIETHRESDVSPMPAGLLDTLEKDEILDLLEFLAAGGTGPAVRAAPPRRSLDELAQDVRTLVAAKPQPSDAPVEALRSELHALLAPPQPEPRHLAVLELLALLPPRAGERPRAPQFPFSSDAARAYRTAYATWSGWPEEFVDARGETFVLIPPGSFRMGSPPDEPDRNADEAPFAATLSRPFYLAKHEASVGRFTSFVEATGYVTDIEKNDGGHAHDGKAVWIHRPGTQWRKPGYAGPFTPGAGHPVVHVSHTDATAYCEWATKQASRPGQTNEPADGIRCTLPTEAEWEWACRAGSAGRFWWGDGLDGAETRMNAGDRRLKTVQPQWPRDVLAGDDGHAFPAPVGFYEANGFGLCDMLGNVWEFCATRAGPYPQEPTVDPGDFATGRGFAVRGGGWSNIVKDARCATRNADPPHFGHSNLGFRVKIALPGR